MNRCEACGRLLKEDETVCAACSPKAESGQPAQAARMETPKRTPQGRGSIGGSGRRRRLRKRRGRLLLALLAVAVIIAALIVFLPKLFSKTRVSSTVQYPAALSDGGAQPGSGSGADQPAYTSQLDDTNGGEAKTETPNVVGVQLAQAQEQLMQLGFVVEATAAEYDPSVGDGAVLTQSKPAGEWGLSGDHIALTYNALPMTLNVFAFAPREGRITLGNLVEVCKMLDTTNPTFSFSVVIHATETYELKGGFRCLTGDGEETPIARVNTQLLRDGKAIKGLEAENAYDDSIGWTIKLQDWTGFHFDHVTGYDVTVTSRADESLKLTRSFAPLDTQSMTLLDCGFATGRVRLDVADEKQLIVRITDDALQTGYPISAAKGKQTPLWEIKLPIDSYRWIGVTLDGAQSQSIDAMTIRGAKFLYTKKTAKDQKPASFDGVSYSVDGNTLVIAITIPNDAEFSVYDIAWLELSMDGGAFQFKTRIR